MLLPPWLGWIPRGWAAVRGAAGAQRENQRLQLENASLRDQLELRQTIDDQAEQIRFLNSRVKELEGAAVTKSRVVRAMNALWIEVDGKHDGPFCQTCYGVNQQLVPLMQTPKIEGKRDSGRCGACKNNVWLVDTDKIEEARRQAPVPRRGSWVHNWRNDGY